MKRKESSKVKKEEIDMEVSMVFPRFISKDKQAETSLSTRVVITDEVDDAELFTVQHEGILEYIRIPFQSVMSGDRIICFVSTEPRLLRVVHRDTRRLIHTLTTEHPITRVAGTDHQFVIAMPISDNQFLVFQWVKHEESYPLFAFCVYSDTGIQIRTTMDSESDDPCIRLCLTWNHQEYAFQLKRSDVQLSNGKGSRLKSCPTIWSSKDTEEKEGIWSPKDTEEKEENKCLANYELKHHYLRYHRQEGHDSIQTYHKKTNSSLWYIQQYQSNGNLRIVDCDSYIVYGDVDSPLGMMVPYYVPTTTSPLYQCLVSSLLPCVADIVLAFLFPVALDCYATNMMWHNNRLWISRPNAISGAVTCVSLTNQTKTSFFPSGRARVVGWDSLDRILIELY